MNKQNPGVFIGGSTIRKVTGHNAKFIIDNKIGIGAILELEKAGDVIPHIVRTIKPSKVISKPDSAIVGEYQLNKTGVDYVLTGQHDGVDIQRINHFFTTLGVFGVSEATFKKLHESGYTTLLDIMQMTARDFERVPGFQKVSADKAYAAIHKALQNCTMSQLMDASGAFGRSLGETKLKILYDRFGPLLLTDTKTDWAINIEALHGFAANTAQMAAKGLPLFRKFLVTHQKWIRVKKEEAVKNGRFSGQVIVPTGFRDKNLFANITAEGGTVSDSLSKATTLLITKDDKPSLKTEKAYKLGIKRMTLDQFVKQYRM